VMERAPLCCSFFKEQGSKLLFVALFEKSEGANHSSIFLKEQEE